MSQSRTRITGLLLIIFLSISAHAQEYNPVIDVRHYDFHLELTDSSNLIRGQADITLVFRQTALQFGLDLSAKNSEGKGMTVLSVKGDGHPLPFRQENQQLVIEAGDH